MLNIIPCKMRGLSAIQRLCFDKLFSSSCYMFLGHTSSVWLQESKSLQQSKMEQRQNSFKGKLSRLQIIAVVVLSITLFVIRFTDASKIRHRNRTRHIGSSSDDESQTVNRQPEKSSPKLLIILLDGFRWNYYTRQKSELPGFSSFVSEGIHTDWVEPIFPSFSFPTWVTLATGRYPEEHDIIANYILYRPPPSNNCSNATENDDIIFNLKSNTTKSPVWWKSAEPIWITVEAKSDKKVFLANWARCDVPFNGSLPTECTGYVWGNTKLGFRHDLQTALKRLEKGFSLAMVYDDLIDLAGHFYGPDSNEVKLAIKQSDTEIHELLSTIQRRGLKDKINIIVTSDHGMTNLDQSVKLIYLKDYLDMEDIYLVLDSGIIISIEAMPNRTEQLAKKLAKLPPGILVYTKENIPEELHYKRGKFILDFLLLATPGHFIVGLKHPKQIPNEPYVTNLNMTLGVHGYYQMEEMRTAFFAKGPAFKKGKMIQSMSVVDQYQVFMKVLGVAPNEHHGNWSVVKDMFRKEYLGMDNTN